MKKLLLMLCVVALSLDASAKDTITGMVAATAPESSATTETPEETAIEQFTNISATYLSWFDSFDMGYYGLRYEGITSKSGLLYTASFKGSWGITDPGLYQWRIGFGKGWAIQNWGAIVLPISYMMGDYVSNASLGSNGEIKYETDLHFGFVVSPGLRIKAGGLIIGASFDLGADYADKFAFYKGFELSLGITL